MGETFYPIAYFIQSSVVTPQKLAKKPARTDPTGSADYNALSRPTPRAVYPRNRAGWGTRIARISTSPSVVPGAIPPAPAKSHFARERQSGIISDSRQARS